MAGPKDLSVRPPAVAGLFYPADAGQCRNMAQAMLNVNIDGLSGGKNWIGGIVPHAGWICSGAIAGQTIATLAAARQADRALDVIVVFGAIHTPLHIDRAALDMHHSWHVPGGETEICGPLSAKLIESSPSAFVVDARFHRREHAVEVELPMIQLAWPGAAVLPIEVPVLDEAIDIGRRTAKQVQRAGLNAVYLASSDLTHYGANYDFDPVGIGIEAVQWALENDRRLLRVVTDMRVETVVPEVRAHFNACGGGAIAAMMAACREHGAGVAKVLRHTCSHQTLADAGVPQPPDNFVGYASVLVG